MVRVRLFCSLFELSCAACISRYGGYLGERPRSDGVPCAREVNEGDVKGKVPFCFARRSTRNCLRRANGGEARILKAIVHLFCLWA